MPRVANEHLEAQPSLRSQGPQRVPPHAADAAIEDREVKPAERPEGCPDTMFDKRHPVHERQGVRRAFEALTPPCPEPGPQRVRSPWLATGTYRKRGESADCITRLDEGALLPSLRRVGPWRHGWRGGGVGLFHAVSMRVATR